MIFTKIKNTIISIVLINLLSGCVYLKKAPELPQVQQINNTVYPFKAEIPFLCCPEIKRLSPVELFFDADSLYLAIMDTCIPVVYEIFNGRISTSNKKLEQFINKWMHTRYKRSGSTLSGTDCSGFVRSLVKEVYGITLSRSSYTMVKEVIKIKKDELREGDLVFFMIRKGRVSHVGFYLADGYFIHAARRGGVIISSLNEPYYKRTFYAAGRLRF